MPDEYLQRKEISTARDTNFKGTALETQALLLGAFLEEKKKWEGNLSTAWIKLESKTRELERAQSDLAKQPKVKTFLLGLVRIKSSKEKVLIKIINEVSRIKLNLEKLVASEPKPDIYEIAMLGNNLFKPR